ncbi:MULTISPECIES: hypothetical protein [Streptomyces]|uniref:ANTAR domain-containing protein n=1 Tax=Streptomyces siderophoricus TaxID=2802281 RepID=A0ABS1MSM0_9ACTN|nr:hypothetical protein [Streptomyces sp. 9-7]MBL1090730.1 hypothetical protein [Streptomyces sp. 9-7]
MPQHSEHRPDLRTDTETGTTTNIETTADIATTAGIETTADIATTTRIDADTYLVRVSRDEFARRVVARVAPEELPAFALLSRPRARTPRLRDTPLGSGLDEMVGAVTPVGVLVSGWALTAVAGGAADEIKNRSMRLTRTLLDRLPQRLRRRAETEEVAVAVAALSTEQLTSVRASVQAKAVALGMPADQAGVLADAVVGELALLRPGGDEEPTQ